MKALEENFKASGGKFEEFRIGDLFEATNGDTDIQGKHINDKGYYVVSSGLSNNGIIGKSDIEAKIFNENTITIDMFGNVFARDFKYKLVTHARVFSLSYREKNNINTKVILYLASTLSFLNKLFTYDNMCSYNKIKDMVILLPIIHNRLAFNYMEEYIQELELEQIHKLDKYLKSTGLNNYELTDKEKAVLEDKEIEFKEFRVGDILECKTTKHIIIRDTLPGQTPLISRSANNNGIDSYITATDENIINGNCITIGAEGRYAFYQDCDFVAGVKVYTLWHENLNKHSAIYLCTALNKNVYKYSYNRARILDLIKDENIILPYSSELNTIDWQYVETYISAINKLVIANLVKWKDDILKATNIK